jgi:chromosome segregation ATPase
MEKGKTILIEIEKLVITGQPIEPVGPEDVERLKRSVMALGLLYPLLVRDLPDDTFEVLDGRTRLGVLRELGYTAVECSLADPALYTAVIPYETELCRRHMDVKQRKHYEKEKDALLAIAPHSLLDRLIPALRDKASSMLKNPEIRKEEVALISDWANLSEDRQEKALMDFSAGAVEVAVQEMTEKLDKLDVSKKEIEEELEEARQQIKAKEKEFEQRLKSFAEEAKAQVQALQESKKLVIPDDPEDRDKVIKKIEKEVAKQYADEIKHAKNNLEKANESYKSLQVQLEEKKDAIKALERQKKDLVDENRHYEEKLSTFKELLEQATDIDKTIHKFEGVREDLRTFNELMLGRNFTLKEIGAEKKNQIKKFLAEIQVVLSETANIVKDIA